MKALLTVAGIIAALLGGSTFYLYDRGATLERRADSLAVVTDTLKFEASRLHVRTTALAAQLDTQMAAESRQNEAEIVRLRTTYDQLVEEMQGEIAQGQVRITRLADRLRVSMVDKILFPSGEAGITPAGLRVLHRVGNVLKSTQSKIIRVEGHTDNVVISEHLKGDSNWQPRTPCSMSRS